MLTRIHRAIAVAAALCVSSCSEAQPSSQTAEQQTRPAMSAPDNELYREMARLSWKYLDTHYQPATGFVDASPEFYSTTLWDLGGQLIAFVAAKELGLLAPAE